MDTGFLEPYDPNKKIYVQTDASKLGLGYVLYQKEGDTCKKGEKIIGTEPVSEEEEEKRKGKNQENKDQMSQKSQRKKKTKRRETLSR